MSGTPDQALCIVHNPSMPRAGEDRLWLSQVVVPKKALKFLSGFMSSEPVPCSLEPCHPQNDNIACHQGERLREDSGINIGSSSTM